MYTNNKRPRKRFTNCECIRTLYSILCDPEDTHCANVRSEIATENFPFLYYPIQTGPEEDISQYRERECALHHNSISVYLYTVYNIYIM